MKLAAKRAIKEFEPTLQEMTNKIQTLAGEQVEIVMEWDSIFDENNQDYVSKNMQYVSEVYFEPLVKALATVAGDDFGKEALQEGLKKIVLKNEKKTTNEVGYSFENGVLSIDQKPDANTGEPHKSWRHDYIKNALENGL